MAGPGYDPDPMVAKLNLPDAKPYKSDPKTICSSSEDMLKALTAYQADIDKMTAALKQNISKPKNERLKYTCLLYTSPSPRDGLLSRMPSSA